MKEDKMNAESIGRGEDSRREKKREVEKRKVRSWLKTVSAFANTEGGELIFGIDDNDQIVGLADSKADSEFISQKIKERIDPVPQTVVNVEQTAGGKSLVVVTISKGDDTPYYYLGDGALETYVRIGNESVVAEATDHKRLVLQGKNTSFDARPSSELFDNHSFSKLASRYYSWTGEPFSPKLYRSMSLVEADGRLTNAGLLVCDENPLRQSRVFCTRWNGVDRSGAHGVDALDSMEISGSIITQIEDTLRFIRRNTRVMWCKEATQRREMPEYIERSVTEAVVNAVAHRDYLIAGSEVHVDIYDDRLTIYSPGGMPQGRIIQEMNLSDIPSVRRNPVVADALSQLGYMERKGSGMGKIIGPYRALPFVTGEFMPRLQSDRSQFAVTFLSLAPLGELTQTAADVTQTFTQRLTQTFTQRLLPVQSAILEVVAVTPTLTRKKMAGILGVSENVVKYHLNALKQRGFLVRIGSDNAGRWQVLQGGAQAAAGGKEDEQINDTADPLNDPINDPINLSAAENELLRLLRENPRATYSQLSAGLSKSAPTIKRMLMKLRKENIIARHGSNKSGYWQLMQERLSEYCSMMGKGLNFKTDTEEGRP